MIPPWLYHEDSRYTKHCRNEKASDQRQRVHGNPFAQPTITLHFDSDKNLTVAILRNQSQLYQVYFTCRVEQGTAYERSPLYYELDGYIRENLSKIRLHTLREADQVTVAIGAMEKSDEAQQKEILESRRARCKDESPSPRLQQAAMEIARQHRLSDDLDVMSLFFMRQVNRSFRQVASRMIRTKMKMVDLLITPFVDGYYVSGYSNFVREDSSRVVRHSEQSRHVEFQQWPDIPLRFSDDKHCYLPVDPSKAEFRWRCEELALANLHRWWGDIAIRDYIGQKLVMSWRPGKAENLSLDQVILSTVRLSTPRLQQQHWTRNYTSITFDVHLSEAVQVDDVQYTYQGRASFQYCKIHFLALVKATARLLIPVLASKHREIENDRPLLKEEREYLRLVQEASLF